MWFKTWVQSKHIWVGGTQWGLLISVLGPSWLEPKAITHRQYRPMCEFGDYKIDMTVRALAISSSLSLINSTYNDFVKQMQLSFDSDSYKWGQEDESEICEQWRSAKWMHTSHTKSLLWISTLTTSQLIPGGIVCLGWEESLLPKCTIVQSGMLTMSKRLLKDILWRIKIE